MAAFLWITLLWHHIQNQFTSSGSFKCVNTPISNNTEIRSALNAWCTGCFPPLCSQPLARKWECIWLEKSPSIFEWPHPLNVCCRFCSTLSGVGAGTCECHEERQINSSQLCVAPSPHSWCLKLLYIKKNHVSHNICCRMSLIPHCRFSPLSHTLVTSAV